MEEGCLTMDQAIMKTLDEYELLGWNPSTIRDSLWSTRHLINTTLRMLYARNPDMPKDTQTLLKIISKKTSKE